MCTAAGLPLPTIFIAQEDLSHSAPPIPGLGQIQCVELNAATALRALKSALQLGRWFAEI